MSAPKAGRDLHDELNDNCISCGEEYPEGECPKSLRTCGHHCNHMDTNDHCHWCDAEINEEGEIVMKQEALSDAH